MNPSPPKSNLWPRCRRLARSLVKRHIVMYDGEQCFNLDTYLDHLESELVSILDERKFKLDPHQVARFLWACMTVDSEFYEFRGMPVLG